MTSLGVDYASVDGNAKPDFTKAKVAGARIMIPRAVYGRPVIKGTSAPFRDPVWARDKDAILAAGLQRSAYLFVCYPRNGWYTPNAETQAQAFIDYVGNDLSVSNSQNMVPMFDVEEASDVLSSSEMFDWTLRVATVLRKHYGAWPGMYTSNRVWQENLKAHASGILQNCPLWIAKPWPWPPRKPVHLDGAPGYNPTTIPQFGDTSNWLVYQYAGDATGMPGFTSTTDTNRCNVVSKGAKGTIVRWIQARVGAVVDGDFGPATEAEVKKVQAEHRLVVDGIVGIATSSVLSWKRPAAC